MHLLIGGYFRTTRLASHPRSKSVDVLCRHRQIANHGEQPKDSEINQAVFDAEQMVVRMPVGVSQSQKLRGESAVVLHDLREGVKIDDWAVE